MADEIKGTDGLGKQPVPPPGVKSPYEAQKAGESAKVDAKDAALMAAMSGVLPSPVNAALNAFALLSPKMKKFIEEGKVSTAKAEKVRGKIKDGHAENAFAVRNVNDGEIATS